MIDDYIGKLVVGTKQLLTIAVIALYYLCMQPSEPTIINLNFVPNIFKKKGY